MHFFQIMSSFKENTHLTSTKIFSDIVKSFRGVLNNDLGWCEDAKVKRETVSTCVISSMIYGGLNREIDRNIIDAYIYNPGGRICIRFLSSARMSIVFVSLIGKSGVVHVPSSSILVAIERRRKHHWRCCFSLRRKWYFILCSSGRHMITV